MCVRVAVCALILLAALNPSPSGRAGDVNYVYDALGRLVAVIDPSGDTATYQYDAVGNLLGITRQGVEKKGRESFLNMKKRDDLRVYLKDKGVDTEIYYPVSMHL